MSETKTAWEILARPPKSALKQIKGGRLSGMTDINPQWRYKAMTDVFGQCGNGWKYEIQRTWTEQGTVRSGFHVCSSSGLYGVQWRMVCANSRYWRLNASGNAKGITSPQ